MSKWDKYEVKRQPQAGSAASMPSSVNEPKKSSKWDKYEVTQKAPQSMVAPETSPVYQDTQSAPEVSAPGFDFKKAIQAVAKKKAEKEKIQNDYLNRYGVDLSQPEGWGGVRRDLKNLAINAPRDAWNMIEGTLFGGIDAAKELAMHPIKSSVRIPTNLGLGALGFIEKVQNAPSNVINYLADKGLVPEESRLLANEYAISGTDSLNQLLLGDKSEADAFWQGLAPFGMAGKALKKAPVLTTAGITGIMGDNPIAGAGLAGVGKGIKGRYEKYKENADLNKMFERLDKERELKDRELSDLSDDIVKADEKLSADEINLAEAREAKGQAQFDMEGTQIETGIDKAKTAAKRIRATEEKIKALEEQRSQIPDTSALNQAEALFNESQTNRLALEKDIKQSMGRGLTLNEHVAEAIYEAHQKIAKENKKNYKDVTQELENVEVPIIDNTKLDALAKDLRKYMESATEEQFQVALQRAIDTTGNVTKSKKIKANDYLDEYKDMIQRAYKLFEAIPDSTFVKTREGVSLTNKEPQIKIGKKELTRMGKEALKIASDMDKIMAETFPPETYQKLKAANAVFRDVIAPMRESPTWHQIKGNRKIVGQDLVEKLGGKSKANVAMRNYILSNPKASAMMVGSRLLKKIKDWHEPSEALAPYLQAAPEVKAMLSEHQRALQNENNAQNIIKELSPHRESQLKLESQAKELQSDLRRYQESHKKLREKEKVLNDRIKDIDKKIKDIRLTQKQKNLLISQKKKAITERKIIEKDLKETKSKIDKNKSRLAKILGASISALAGVSIVKSLF